MFQMAVGHSDDIDPEVVVEELVEQCTRSLDRAQPNAGLLFSTYDTQLEPLISGLRAAYPDVDLVGTTSQAEISSTGGFREDSVTLALFASDTVETSAGIGEGVAASPEAAARQALEQAAAGVREAPQLAIALPCITGDDPSRLLRELELALGDVPVLGGGSAPRTPPGEPLRARQFHNDRILEDAAPILLFSGPLESSFGIDTGWRPVGRRGRITDAGPSTIRRIDDEPALAFYQRYLGEAMAPTPANPLAIFEDDPADFYLRVPIAADEHGSVRVAGGVPNGANVQLTVGMTDEIFAGTRSAVRKAVEGFGNGGMLGAALIFSCAIRKLVLGTRTGRELDIVRHTLGASVPICGFYCYGEIAPIASGSSRFHNETIVAVLLGESA
jgi:hypothetical protein